MTDAKSWRCVTAMLTPSTRTSITLGPPGSPVRTRHSASIAGPPLALTIISGLLASTVLTLVLVPVVYTLLDRGK